MSFRTTTRPKPICSWNWNPNQTESKPELQQKRKTKNEPKTKPKTETETKPVMASKHPTGASSSHFHSASNDMTRILMNRPPPLSVPVPMQVDCLSSTRHTNTTVAPWPTPANFINQPTPNQAKTRGLRIRPYDRIHITFGNDAIPSFPPPARYSNCVIK